jgi:hypothetical protein
MRGEVHRDSGITGECGDQVLDVKGGHAAPGPVAQQRAAVPTVDRESDRLQGGRGKGDHRGSIAFGGGQLQVVMPAVGTEVLDVAGDQLPAP